jgi:hypothetical protein
MKRLAIFVVAALTSSASHVVATGQGSSCDALSALTFAGGRITAAQRSTFDAGNFLCRQP